jgi:hypothetical protein
MFSLLSQPDRNLAINFLRSARMRPDGGNGQLEYAFFNHEQPFASQKSPPNMLPTSEI